MLSEFAEEEEEDAEVEEEEDAEVEEEEEAKEDAVGAACKKCNSDKRKNARE